VPWNCIVWLTMPAPGDRVASTRMYAFASVVPASVRPSSPANCLSGRMPIRSPPPFTHVLSIDTWAAVSV
jgi:hypothetical protein